MGVLAIAVTACANGRSHADEGPALVAITVADKWGFADPAGNVKVEPRFDWVWDFGAETVTAACIGQTNCDQRLTNMGVDPNWSVIDTSGRPIGNQHFIMMRPFSEGLAAACVEPVTSWNSLYNRNTTECTWWSGKWGFVDRTGAVTIGGRFTQALPFSEGRAAVCLAGCDPWGGGTWTYIDKAGKEIVTSRFQGAGAFRNGLAPVKTDGRWGYIGYDGRTKIQAQFARAESFHENLALACQGEERRDRLCGFVDLNGKYLISPRFDEGLSFSEGLAAVQLDKKWGFVDPSGQLIVPAQYRRAMSFSGGLAAVCAEQPQGDCKWGFIDVKGNWAIKPQFPQPGFFRHGVAAIRYGRGAGDRFGVIDKRGTFVFSPAS